MKYEVGSPHPFPLLKKVSRFISLFLVKNLVKTKEVKTTKRATSERILLKCWCRMQLTREIWGWLAPSISFLKEVSQPVGIFQSNLFWRSILITFILLCFHEIFRQKFDLLTREIWVWLAPSVSGLKKFLDLFAFLRQILF